MKPENKIKRAILLKDTETDHGPLTTDKLVSAAFDKANADYGLQDLSDAFRDGEVETDVEPPYSRNYESKSVASQMDDGSWVGWTYWYGGGKHGNPEEIPWIEDTYDLTCVEEKQTATVRKFTKV